MSEGPKVVVLDTNIVLDVFLFSDPAVAEVRTRLEAGSLDWVATAHMREELSRVLAYPQILPRLAFYQLTAQDVLVRFDRHVRAVEPAGKAVYTCRDADDQCFIDLAVAHKALLLSKDKAVLTMKKRLSTLDVAVQKTL